MNEEIIINEKETKGEIFKRRNGYSKSTKRLLSKHKISFNEGVEKALSALRLIRKNFRKYKHIMRKRKHTDALAGRKLSTKTPKIKKQNSKKDVDY